MNLTQAIQIAQAGVQEWANRPHNARWWRRIDGTPIPNDLSVNIAEAFYRALQQEPQASGLATGSLDTDRQPEPRAELSPLVPELTRALRAIIGTTDGFYTVAMPAPLREQALSALSQAEQAANAWNRRAPVPEQAGDVEAQIVALLDKFHDGQREKKARAIVAEIVGPLLEERTRERDALAQGRGDDCAVSFAAANPDAAQPTQSAEEFRRVVASVSTSPEDLSLIVTNILYGRGALPKEVKREAVIAIKTYRTVLEVARDPAGVLALRPDEPTPSSQEAGHAE